MMGLARAAAFVLAALLLAGAGTRFALSQERAAAQQPAAACRAGDFRVVLDVGHTAEVPGAISAHGIPEFLFNLRLAESAKQKLVEAGFDRTALLVTDRKPPLGLFERVWHANKLGADLFIAIALACLFFEIIKSARVGMKSMTVTAPSAVSNSVSRISVSAR